VPEWDDLDWDQALARAYRVAYAVLRDADRARDVAQKACVKALVHLSSLQERRSFPGWVRRIAYHLALDAWQAPPLTGDDPDALAGTKDPERDASARQAARALHRCLAKLTEHQREIFLAKHLDQMKGADIAAELGAKEGTVWATLHQTATKLRRCLEEQGVERAGFH
jgi:RNA polymerase sigma-70 factor (ECF subfamily)